MFSCLNRICLLLVVLLHFIHFGNSDGNIDISFHELLAEVKQLRSELADSKSRLQAAESKIEHLQKTDCSRGKRQESIRIAFSAVMSLRNSGLHTQDAIPFGQVLLNSGNFFDANTHAFTCPITGIYVFQSAVTSDSTNYVNAEIVKNGQGLVAMHADGPPATDQGFNSVVVKCLENERVWVRIIRGSGVYYGEYSSFSGYLLYETNP